MSGVTLNMIAGISLLCGIGSYASAVLWAMYGRMDSLAPYLLAIGGAVLAGMAFVLSTISFFVR